MFLTLHCENFYLTRVTKVYPYIVLQAIKVLCTQAIRMAYFEGCQ